MRTDFLTVTGLGAAAVASMLALAPVARADSGPPPRTRGVITAMTDTSVTLKTRFGGPVTLKITPDTGYVGATKASLAEAKQGRFIGVAANPGPGGTLVAREVTIFPEAMRGAGEGHYGWDLGRQGSMTNGTIGTVSGSSGRTMTVDYKGGKTSMTVPADAPVVDLEAGDKSLLKAGAHVVAFGPKSADGSVDAKRIVVGVDGAVPPM
ncbi:DUF5666 domain-containing protein [Lichenicoccus roseus]|uniref:DUF5666 domain-containing protein n=1 Tax=Lichenicoccus roseus TaxID=2683649 RepID=A0A5R9JE29_9PROT|nr:DUF5666 domain-containing protein [Lichenicoccus roseus]TLU73881.1 hypothetical protein FE263_01225 [Lichenicoccus roseus]